MTKKSKTAKEYLSECISGKRKTVPEIAFREAMFAKADANTKSTMMEEELRLSMERVGRKNDQIHSLEKELQNCRDGYDRMMTALNESEAKNNQVVIDTSDLKDQFAMAALQAMGAVMFAGEPEDTARVAFDMAEAMLAERKNHE